MDDALVHFNVRRITMTSYIKDESKNRKADEKKSSGNQGFASMPKEQVREIAREGGKHSHDNDAKNKAQSTSKALSSGSNSEETDDRKSSTSRSTPKPKDR